MIRTFGSPVNGDDALGPIAFDPAGNVWVQVPSLSSVYEFSPAGEPLTQLDLSSTVSSFPFGLAIDAAGRFYVVDGNSAKIHVFDTAGNELFSFGERGRDPGQLNAPWWIALDGSGGVYVGDKAPSRVQGFAIKE